MAKKKERTANEIVERGVAEKKRRRKSARANVNDVKRRERMAEALEYRRQGYTYAQIGEEMSISAMTAHKYVKEAIQETIPEEVVADVRRMELDRLDYMQQPLFANFAQSPEKDTIDAILRIMDRRARYLGLYKSEDDTARALDQMGASLAAMVAADKPVLRPDERVPKNPVL